jgi:hypothetical protein
MSVCLSSPQDVVEVMAPTYTMGLHDVDTSTRWTTSDVMCYFVSAQKEVGARIMGLFTSWRWRWVTYVMMTAFVRTSGGRGGGGGQTRQGWGSGDCAAFGDHHC